MATPRWNPLFLLLFALPIGLHLEERCIISAARAAAPGEADKVATLEQIISREDPKFDCATSVLTVGRDGNVYLSSIVHNGGYILRVSRDGSQKLGGDAVYAMANATANAAGVIASANAHFNHAVNLYDREFKQFAACKDFLNNDQAGWNSPSRVEAGASGDFYGLDNHRDRILRIDATGKIVQAHAIPAEAAAVDFRVCEATKAFYLRSRDGTLRCIGFDGAARWERLIPGLFTVDDAGTLYLLTGEKLKKLSPAGEPLGEIAVPAKSATGIAVWRDELIVKRADPAELFQVHVLGSGELKRVVPSAHERFAAELPGLVWTAGGYPLAFANNAQGKPLLDDLQKRLGADPAGVAPQKAEFGFPHAHALAGWGAFGVREMLMLVGMDAGLPIGASMPWAAGVTPQQYAAGIHFPYFNKNTRILATYTHPDAFYRTGVDAQIVLVEDHLPTLLGEEFTKYEFYNCPHIPERTIDFPAGAKTVRYPLAGPSGESLAYNYVCNNGAAHKDQVFEGLPAVTADGQALFEVPAGKDDRHCIEVERKTDASIAQSIPIDSEDIRFRHFNRYGPGVGGDSGSALFVEGKLARLHTSPRHGPYFGHDRLFARILAELRRLPADDQGRVWGWRDEDSFSARMELLPGQGPNPGCPDAVRLNGDGLKHKFHRGLWHNGGTRVTAYYRFDAPFRFTVTCKAKTPNVEWEVNRQLVYEPVDAAPPRNGDTLHFALGSEAADGTWRCFARDITADLRQHFADDALKSVAGLTVQGSGLLSGVKTADP